MTAAPAAPAPKSKELSSLMRIVITMMVPVFVAAAVAGSAGTFVLLDLEKKEHPISHTKFAELWVKMVEINPMFNVLFFVGGLYGILWAYVKLRDDVKARADKMEKEVKEKESKKKK